MILLTSYREEITIVLLDPPTSIAELIYDLIIMLKVELSSMKGTITSSFLQNLTLKIGFALPY
jgi:Ca2+/H+ antiporter